MLNKLYVHPECEIEATSLVSIICVSPDAGGLEDVEYEDWVV